jgi:DtxR family Mn-dependent transcriptional regulator
MNVSSKPTSRRSASPVMREYLAEIYRIASYQPDSDWVGTSELADRMDVSAPAVARMASRLKRRDLLEHEPYRGMRLTPAGWREAMLSLRQHRLTEIFLVQIMGFGWHEVHDEADAISPTLTPILMDRMSEMAGHPLRCPHGEPIPTADGRMPIAVDQPLTALTPPAELVVSRIHTHDGERLVYLASLNLVPGHPFKLVSRAPFEGPLRLEVDGSEVVIGVELARELRACAPADFQMKLADPPPLPDDDAPDPRGPAPYDRLSQS